MANSGTYAFQPSGGELMMLAYARCGMRRNQVLQEHVQDAINESNFVLVELSNRQPIWFTQETYDNVLTPGTSVYTLPARVVSLVAVYMTTTSGGVSTDRILPPMSAYDYSSLPQKTTQAPPTVYYFQRLLAPQITVWPVPDNSQTYVLHSVMLCQPQDAVLPSGGNVAIPYCYLDAYVANLAARLAVIYAPDRLPTLAPLAERAWEIAAKTDTEDVPLNIVPGLSMYVR